MTALFFGGSFLPWVEPKNEDTGRASGTPKHVKSLSFDSATQPKTVAPEDCLRLQRFEKAKSVDVRTERAPWLRSILQLSTLVLTHHDTRSTGNLIHPEQVGNLFQGNLSDLWTPDQFLGPFFVTE